MAPLPSSLSSSPAASPTPVPFHRIISSSSINTSNSARRTIACTACHKSKVRCVQDNPNQPCVRCRKANKRCVIDPSQLQKRQKLSASSLEKQVKSLSEELSRQKQLVERLKRNNAETNTFKNPNLYGAYGYNDLNTSNNSIQTHPHLTHSNAETPENADIINEINKAESAVHTSNDSTAANSPITTVKNEPNKVDISTLINSPSPAHLLTAMATSSSFDSIPRLVGTHFQARSHAQNGDRAHQKFNINDAKDGSKNASKAPVDFLSAKTKHDLISELHSINTFNLQKFYNVSSNFSSIGTTRHELLKKDYSQETDVIRQGLLTHDQVQLRLRLYMTKMYTRYSIVAIPERYIDAGNLEDMLFDIDRFRETSPVLYLAILAISAIAIPHSVERSDSLNVDLKLNIKAIDLISHEVLVTGNKSIELLQSLLLMCIWYDSAELFQHRRYQLMNMLCVCMALDLGLNGRTIYYFSKVESIVKRAPLSDISQSIESRKLALAVYFTNISYSLFLKRVTTVKWNSYYEECFGTLMKQSNPQIRKLAILAKLNSCLQKVCSFLHASELDPFDINDSRTRYIIADLHQSCLKVKKLIDDDDYAMMSYYYSIEAYLFEPSLHRVLISDGNRDPGPKKDSFNKQGKNSSPEKDPLENDNAVLFSTYMISTIGRCCESCIKGLTYYAKLSHEEVVTLPLILQSRIFYMCGIILRLRYLTLLVPKYSEVSALPHNLLHVLNEVMEINCTTSEKFPYNYFLPKSRLVLMLFLQTFTGQIRNALENRFGVNESNVSEHDLQPVPPPPPTDSDDDLASLRPALYHNDWSAASNKNSYNQQHLSHQAESTPYSPLAFNIARNGSNLKYGTMNNDENNTYTPTNESWNARYPNNIMNPKSNLKDLFADLSMFAHPSLTTNPPVNNNVGQSSINMTQNNGTIHPESNAPQPISAWNSGNGFSFQDFLFDNSGTANHVGIDVPMSNDQLGSFQTGASFNNTQTNSNISNVGLNQIPVQQQPQPVSGAANSGEFSYFALNDNMWNDLLLGIDFNGSSNINWE